MSKESLVSSVYRSRSHSFPRPAKNKTTEEKASNKDIKVENKQESEDSVLIKFENKPESEDCIEKNKFPLPDLRKSDVVLATDSNRRFKDSMEKKEDVGDYQHTKKALSKNTISFFEKAKKLNLFFSVEQSKTPSKHFSSSFSLTPLCFHCFPLI